MTEMTETTKTTGMTEITCDLVQHRLVRQPLDDRGP
ncbi:Uncharacterised protein [Actinomyces howellii]|uniref:Uncharacterized protein n=1 Tax=Actinomyces howellii TaxID=52771 RepID=A0A3S4RV47_9ACTO|nr:Uncharacterised protein [Actinomyces howellii]